MGGESSTVLNVSLAKRRRQELGLKMWQVAEMCGVGVGVISRWEAGKREPRNSDSLKRWALALQLDAADLVGDPEPEEASPAEVAS